jgi:hypothetical protein
VVGVAGNKGRAERRIPRGRSFPLRLRLVEVPCHERHHNRRTTRWARGRAASARLHEVRLKADTTY